MRRLAPLLLLLLAPVAHAQLLNLSPTEEPSPAPGIASRNMAAFLEQQIQVLSVRSPRTPRLDAEMSMRRLALALINTGDEMGPAGSRHVLAGMTLARHLGEIDQWLRSTPGDSFDASLVYFNEDMHELRDDVPRERDEVRRFLRDRLAILLTAEPASLDGVGWVLDDATPTLDLAVLDRARPQVSEACNESLDALLVHLDDAATRAPYVRSALVVRSALIRAARVLSPEPRWLEQDARSRLIEEFEQGVAQLDGGGGGGLARLERLAAFASLIDSVDAMSSTRHQKEIRAAIVQAILYAPQDPGQQLASLEAAQRAFALLDAEESLRNERTIFRELRPLRRRLERRMRVTADELAARIPDMISTPGAMVDPGVLAQLHARRSVLEDARAIERITRTLTTAGEDGREPRPSDEHERLVGALLSVTRNANPSDPDDRPTRIFRAFVTQLEQARVSPSERIALDPPTDDPVGQEVAHLLADQKDRIRVLVEQERAAWVEAWESDDPVASGAPHATRLAQIDRVLSCVVDVATIRAVRRRPETLNAWPGWELSDEAVRRLSEPFEDRTLFVVRRLLTENATVVAPLIDRLESEHPDARLIALMARRAHDRGIALASSGAPALYELGVSCPDGYAWMDAHAEDVARFCRYGEELSAALQTGEEPAARALRLYLTPIASRLLESLSNDREAG